MRLAWHVVSTGGKRNAHKVLARKHVGSKPLVRLKLKWILKETSVYTSSCDIYIQSIRTQYLNYSVFNTTRSGLHGDQQVLQL
jgi:hypothetical protein